MGQQQYFYMNTCQWSLTRCLQLPEFLSGRQTHAIAIVILSVRRFVRHTGDSYLNGSMYLNPFTADPVEALHFAILV